MAEPYGRAIWQSHMAEPYGNAIWQSHMAAAAYVSQFKHKTFSEILTVKNDIQNKKWTLKDTKIP